MNDTVQDKSQNTAEENHGGKEIRNVAFQYLDQQVALYRIETVPDHYRNNDQGSDGEGYGNGNEQPESVAKRVH